MNLELAGKTAIITGATKGMGAAFAEGFAQEGANLVINCRKNLEEARSFAQELEEKYSVKAIAVLADISNEQQVSDMMRQAADTFGHIDILVNNAGMWPTQNFMDISAGDWRKIIDINLNGAFLCSQTGCRYMIPQGSGHIVNIGSKSGISVSSGGHSHYASSKGGITMFTKALAREVTKDGIIVNCVIPGMVATPINQAQRDDPDMMEYYINRLPMGRFSEPKDIANAVLFMASERAAFTAGSIFDVSGGLLL